MKQKLKGDRAACSIKVGFIYFKYKSNESWAHHNTTTSSSTMAVEPECEDGLNGIDLRSKHTPALLRPCKLQGQQLRQLGHDACAGLLIERTHRQWE